MFFAGFGRDGTGPLRRRKSLILLIALLVAFLLAGGCQMAPDHVLTGADRLREAPYVGWFEGKRIGLITNQTGVDLRLHATSELLQEIPGARLAALFAPEHGLDGALQAGEAVPSGLRVHSLYGATRSPEPAMLAGLDVLVYDIQDVGARHYTFPSTMLESMRAAAAAGIPFIVLDRPDPLGGEIVEGPLMQPDLASFVGISGLPVRYAMTPGELAQMLNGRLQLGCDLKVVPLAGWRRSMWFDQTGLAWVPPSPNMPTLDTATVYPGFCLIEGTNLSEGRGTTRPFELVGAPWLKNRQLAENLNRRQLPGVLFRPQSFTPTFSKHQGQTCRGIQIHVTDRESFRSFRTALVFLEETIRLHPNDFQFEPSFDRLAGTPSIRETLKNGDPPPPDWPRPEFEEARVEALLYW